MALPPNSENAPFSKSSSNQVATSNVKAGDCLDLVFLTLFPEVFTHTLQFSLIGKAQEKGFARCRTFQIRDFAQDRHRSVDDTPFGGGEGMVLRADVLDRAHQAAQAELDVLWSSGGNAGGDAQNRVAPPVRKTILLSPQGVLLTQERAKEWSGHLDQAIIVCGHYEGLDERFIEKRVDLEVSIGDYVLTGGELPALVLADVLIRLRPGVVGNESSVLNDSLEGGLLKYPQYTRPRDFEGLTVPEVLLQGNHRKIQEWRQDQMLDRTARKRPDLWETYQKKTKN